MTHFTNEEYWRGSNKPHLCKNPHTREALKHSTDRALRNYIWSCAWREHLSPNEITDQRIARYHFGNGRTPKEAYADMMYSRWRSITPWWKRLWGYSSPSL